MTRHTIFETFRKASLWKRIKCICHVWDKMVDIELGKKETYASVLGRKLKLDPRLIRFHLSTLYRNGLIDGELKETPHITNTYAVRYWWLTERGNKMLQLINHIRGLSEV